MFTNQSEDSERCESMELDKKIQDLIERNASPHPKGFTPQAMTTHRNLCSPKTPGKTASMAHFVQGTSRMTAAERSTEHNECAESSTRKNLTNSLEQKIRCLEKQRKELLEVNQQWDQQFRSMKELYERKVAELKTKLDAAERFLSLREKERHERQGEDERQREEERQREDDRQRDLTRDRLQREEKEKERLNEELHELKEENKLLKEKNALVNEEKEHYECEIKRLNKVLQDALNFKCSFSEDCLRKSRVEFCHEEMRTEMEVLKQQVQIYEEDFKKERSDRERLNQEKEELQQINETSQSQLNRLNSQIKACQMEKEKLEKQLKQMYFPTCNCGLVFHLQDPWLPTGAGAVQKQREHPPDYQWYALDQLPPDVQHKANGFSSKKKVNQ
ncbi:TNFAIP3-interacting protein 3 [Piliocolobus tephrosceles]|uniref:TNFAIP3-interacting protein 3 n=1 Tax=Piliocolobus tephrosceles TaxID=591936 RepID=UPI000C2AB6A3|nr:TNFAIP3-interacting protein 3 [Piliocolobus tephrosceles]